MDFGNYFRDILNKKNIAVADLAENLNIKSKNEIYRLFQNKYSYDKTNDLTKRILSVIEVSPSEEKELYRLMNECKTGYSERKANIILSRLYEKSKFDENPKFNVFLDFIKANLQRKITIYIGVITESQSVMLSKLLNAYPKINAIHTVDFGTADENIARQLFAIITLFRNDNCRLFKAVGQSETSIMAVAEDDNVCKTAVFDNNTLYTSDISKEMAHYIYDKKLVQCGDELKQNRVRIADYEQMLKYACDCDLNDTYAIHGMICLAEIPFKIIYKLFEDANYFGFPLEHPYIQSMLGVEKKHDELRRKTDTSHFYFLSENYMKRFLETGITSGYINEFRPLNFEERIETLDIFRHRGKGVKYYGRFMKEGYDIIETECCSIDNIGVYITDSQSRHKETYMQAVINHPKAMKVFRNFSRWFWDNCMYNDEESLDLLDGYIEAYKNKQGNSKM